MLKKPLLSIICVILALSGCALVPPDTSANNGVVPSPDSISKSAPVTPPSTAATPTPEPLLPDAAKLVAALNKVSSEGIGATGWQVIGPEGVIASSNEDKPLTPASTMKILTTMAAVDAQGADARYETRVYQTAADEIVLVGGGDPFLVDSRKGHTRSTVRLATLQGLAETTAKMLQMVGINKVRLGYDDSYFSGATWSKSWKKAWSTYTARVTSLTVDSGMETEWRAATDPSKLTAQKFAKRLAKAGIKVSATRKTNAAADAKLIAIAYSAPVADIAAHVLEYSHNLGAEVLLRQYAKAVNATPSFDGASKALKGWLQEHQLWSEGMVIDGGSGLSPKARVSPYALTKAVSIALGDSKYAYLAEGLPVAGKTGTLKNRFKDKSEAAGKGKVHAKTGTLRGLATLAGFVQTKDGALLQFAFMANDAPSQSTAYHWLDRSATVLAKCGCR